MNYRISPCCNTQSPRASVRNDKRCMKPLKREESLRKSHDFPVTCCCNAARPRRRGARTMRPSAAVHESVTGPPRHSAATHQFFRFRSEADVNQICEHDESLLTTPYRHPRASAGPVARTNGPIRLRRKRRLPQKGELNQSTK